MKSDLRSIIILLILGFGTVFRHFFLLPVHWDEWYAVAKSNKFDWYFVQRDYSQDKWRLQIDDHPPVIHYLVGGVLRFSGLRPIQAKQLPYIDMSFFLGNTNQESIDYTVNNLMFMTGRAMNAIIGVVGLIVLYMVLRHNFTATASLLGCLLITQTPLFKEITPRLLLESPQFLFLVTTWWLMLLSIKSIKTREIIFVSFLAGLTAALCYLTKINGLAALLSCVGIWTVLWIKNKFNYDYLGRILVISLSFIFFSIALFPSSWSKPITLQKELFEWRMKLTQEKMIETQHYQILDSRKYRELNYSPVNWGGPIVNPLERLAMILQRMFYYFDPVREHFGFPLLGYLLVRNVIDISWRLAKKIRVTELEIGIWGWIILLLGVYLGSLMLDQARHYYLLLVLPAVVAANGFQICYRDIQVLVGKVKKMHR